MSILVLFSHVLLIHVLSVQSMIQQSSPVQFSPVQTNMTAGRSSEEEETGGDNSNKRFFGTKPKLFRESGYFSGNRDIWKIFRETRDHSGTLQKKIGTSKGMYPKNSGGCMIQVSGTT